MTNFISSITEYRRRCLDNIKKQKKTKKKDDVSKIDIEQVFKKCDIKKFKLLLEDKDRIYELSKFKLTDMLIKIITKDRVDIFVLILDKFRINPLNTYNYSSFLILCGFYGGTKCAIELAERGAYIDHRDNNGYTPLMYACKKGHFETAKYLLMYRASIYRKNIYGLNAYDIARRHHNYRIAYMVATIFANDLKEERKIKKINKIKK